MSPDIENKIKNYLDRVTKTNASIVRAIRELRSAGVDIPLQLTGTQQKLEMLRSLLGSMIGSFGLGLLSAKNPKEKARWEVYLDQFNYIASSLQEMDQPKLVKSLEGFHTELSVWVHNEFNKDSGLVTGALVEKILNRVERVNV